MNAVTNHISYFYYDAIIHRYFYSVLHVRDKQTFTIFLYYIKSLINSQFVISFNSLHYNNLKMLKIYLFGSRVRIASLLFAKQRAIHRVVLLQLHSLHLLLDRVHGGGLICSLVHEKKNVSTTLSKRDYYHTCALECVFIILLPIHALSSIDKIVLFNFLHPVPGNSIDSQGERSSSRAFIAPQISMTVRRITNAINRDPF